VVNSLLCGNGELARRSAKIAPRHCRTLGRVDSTERSVGGFFAAQRIFRNVRGIVHTHSAVVFTNRMIRPA
jgi:hypothetical protein